MESKSFPEIATSASWDNLESMPKESILTKCSVKYSKEEFEHIKRGIVPEEMEEKWFIYFEGDKLYFHRSWTGALIFIAKFKNLEIISIETNNSEDVNQSTIGDCIEFVSKIISGVILSKLRM
jgi:hypothetical protein